MNILDKTSGIMLSIPQKAKNSYVNFARRLPHEHGLDDNEDVFRSRPIRYLAYTNEIGEALRPLGNRLANALWIPAILYIVGSTVDKYLRGEGDDYKKPSIKRLFEEGVFQFSASVAMPTALVMTTQKVTEKILNKANINVINSHPTVKKACLVIAGLSALAPSIKPIDKFTEKFIIGKFVHPALYKTELITKSISGFINRFK